MNRDTLFSLWDSTRERERHTNTLTLVGWLVLLDDINNQVVTGYFTELTHEHTGKTKSTGELTKTLNI